MRSFLSDFWPFVLLVIAAIVVIALAYKNGEDRKADCREMGGVVVPDDDGWSCQLYKAPNVERPR